MSDEGASETPYEQAKRLHAAGHSPEQVLAALRSAGLAGDDAQIVARAARGEAGVALDLKEAPAAEPPPEPPTEAPKHPCPKHAQWPVRAPCERCGTFFCTQCLREAGRPFDSARCPACEEVAPVAQGIGGWLLFPAIGLVVTPISLLVGLVEDLKALSSELIPGVALPVTLEAIVNLGLIIYGLVCAVAFFQRKRIAVPLMIGFYSAGLVSVAINAGLASWVNELVGQPGEPLGPTSVRGVGTSVIWIAYFLQSKRVKATFVR